MLGWCDGVVAVHIPWHNNNNYNDNGNDNDTNTNTNTNTNNNDNDNDNNNNNNNNNNNDNDNYVDYNNDNDNVNDNDNNNNCTLCTLNIWIRMWYTSPFPNICNNQSLMIQIEQGNAMKWFRSLCAGLTLH